LIDYREARVHAAPPVKGEAPIHFGVLVQRADARWSAFRHRAGAGLSSFIHFTDPPAGEEPHPRPAISAPPPDELSVERLQAIMRALDEVLAEARSLRARIDGQTLGTVSANAAGE
jgi:hypothetical protein